MSVNGANAMYSLQLDQLREALAVPDDEDGALRSENDPIRGNLIPVDDWLSFRHVLRKLEVVKPLRRRSAPGSDQYGFACFDAAHNGKESIEEDETSTDRKFIDLPSAQYAMDDIGEYVAGDDLVQLLRKTAVDFSLIKCLPAFSTLLSKRQANKQMICSKRIMNSPCPLCKPRIVLLGARLVFLKAKKS